MEWFYEWDSKKWCSVFFLFHNYTLGKGHGPSFVPFTQGYLIPSLVEIGLEFWRRLLNVVNIFLFFHIYLPLKMLKSWTNPFSQKWLLLNSRGSGGEVFLLSPIGKGYCPSIWTNLNPLHSRKFCAKFDWNWASGSGENVKVYKTDDRCTTDNRRTMKLTWAFSSGMLIKTIRW